MPDEPIPYETLEIEDDLRPVLIAISQQLAALFKGQRTIMTALAQLATQEGADTTQLINDIQAVQAGQAQAIKSAVAAALQQAGVDAAAAQTILQATDAAVTAEDAKLQAILNPPPTITSANPLTVAGGQPVTGQVTVSAGTIAAATSADGAIAMDANGNLSGTAGASGGNTTLAVDVTGSSGTVTDLSLTIDYQ